MKYTIKQFQAEYPNEDACLQKLFDLRYGNLMNCPKCGEAPIFKRVKGRKSFQCQITKCQYQIYPMAGTVFEKTTTPLMKWFFAMYLFTSTRNGVAAKELERILGVSYPTALRMAHQIKKLMGNKPVPTLFGEVEMDETYIGGAFKNKHLKEKLKLKKGRGPVNKIPVFGMLERNGSIVVSVVDKTNGRTLKPIIRQTIDKTTVVITDGFKVYKGLHKEFSQHEVINHHLYEWARGKYNTNSIEGFWSHLKRMLRGTHIKVSKKHLQKYIEEAVFRYEQRKKPDKMFAQLISQIK